MGCHEPGHHGASPGLFFDICCGGINDVHQPEYIYIHIYIVYYRYGCLSKNVVKTPNGSWLPYVFEATVLPSSRGFKF